MLLLYKSNFIPRITEVETASVGSARFLHQIISPNSEQVFLSKRGWNFSKKVSRQDASNHLGILSF